MKSATVILHTDNPDAALEVLSHDHGYLEFHGCDSYDALPNLIFETQAEVVYSVRFAGSSWLSKGGADQCPIGEMGVDWWVGYRSYDALGPGTIDCD